MKVLYKQNYILRDLYVIEYKHQYIMVYRSSGLNAGRKGRILPFEMLAVPERATLSGDVPGYIYKNFYFNSVHLSHYKDPQSMQQHIGDFLLAIEKFLLKHPTDTVNYDHIKTYKDILPIAKAINKDLNKAIEGLEPFDWATTSLSDITAFLGTPTDSIEPVNNYLESGNAI